MGHSPWTLFTQSWVQCAQLLFSNACDVLRMYSCPACVGGWVALLMTAGVMGEGVGEFNVNSLNRSLHASNICAISFPITLDSSRPPPSFHAGREYITHLPQIFVFTVCISQHPFMNVLIIGGSSWFITVSHECVCGGGDGASVSRGHYFVRSWHEVDFSKRSSDKILVSVYFENKGPDCKRQSRRAASQRSLNGSHRLSDLPDFHCKWK